MKRLINFLKNLFGIKEKVVVLDSELSFYDVKSKTKFRTHEYEIRQKSGRYFAVTKSLSGTHECWRVLTKRQAEELG